MLIIIILGILLIVWAIRPWDDFGKSIINDRSYILEIVRSDILDTFLLTTEPGDMDELKNGQTLICPIKREFLISKLLSPSQDDHRIVLEALQDLNACDRYQFEIEIKVNGIFGFSYLLKVSELPKNSDYLKLKAKPETAEKEERVVEQSKVLAMSAGAGKA